MPKFFTKRKERCNLRSRSKNQSTPKSKVDTCVECDLPFDESKIAPELRRGPVTKEWTSSELLEPSHKNSVAGLTRPTWYPWILVLFPIATTVSVPWPPAPQSSRRIWGRTLLRKKKEKENCTDNIFATGSQRVPASTSPVTGNISPLISTLPSITAPADPTIIEQPEVITNTPIVISYTAGGQHFPTINSPADIYKHFSR